MDPVNKWLTVIIGFMVAMLIVISWKAGSGRYAFEVQDSQYFEKTHVVYVLDTKNGTVDAKMFLEEDLLTGDKRINRHPVSVFSQPKPDYRRY